MQLYEKLVPRITPRPSHIEECLTQVIPDVFTNTCQKTLDKRFSLFCPLTHVPCSQLMYVGTSRHYVCVINDKMQVVRVV